jgi:hypothetical protein
LGLDLVQEGERLRLYDPAKGELLPTALLPTALLPTALLPTALLPTALLPTALEQAERLQDAETELARLRAEIQALKADLGN